MNKIPYLTPDSLPADLSGLEAILADSNGTLVDYEYNEVFSD